MRRRFFVDEVRSGRAELADEDARHLTRVLRVEAGQRYEISDNRHVFLAEIETARKERVIFRTIEQLPNPAPEARIVLCCSLIKFDRLEWIIEKATELGVSKIVPLIGARSEHGLERAALKRIERWRRIALEASQQSRRAHLPEIAEPVEFREMVTAQPTGSHRYALDENPQAPALFRSLPETRKTSDEIAVMTGPEGGWTDEERAAFLAPESQWTAVSMGPLILRAETAAIAALAVIRQAWMV